MRYYSQATNESLYTREEGFGELDQHNRWLVLADKMPWAAIEREYNRLLHNKHHGTRNKPARMLVGALVVKHKLKVSDSEVIHLIQESPYLQCFIGLQEFTTRQPLSPRSLVAARKRMGEDFLRKVFALTDGKTKTRRSKKSDE